MHRPPSCVSASIFCAPLPSILENLPPSAYHYLLALLPSSAAFLPVPHSVLLPCPFSPYPFLISAKSRTQVGVMDILSSANQFFSHHEPQVYQHLTLSLHTLHSSYRLLTLPSLITNLFLTAECCCSHLTLSYPLSACPLLYISLLLSLILLLP